jgi:hypothetical protein
LQFLQLFNGAFFFALLPELLNLLALFESAFLFFPYALLVLAQVRI